MHLIVNDKASLEQAGDVLHDAWIDRESVRYDAEAGEFTMRLNRDPSPGEKDRQYCWLTLRGVEEAQIKLDKEVRRR